MESFMVINCSKLVQMVDQLDYHMVGLWSTCLTILVKLSWAGKPPRTKTNAKTHLMLLCLWFKMLNIMREGHG